VLISLPSKIELTLLDHIIYESITNEFRPLTEKTPKGIADLGPHFPVRWNTAHRRVDSRDRQPSEPRHGFIGILPANVPTKGGEQSEKTLILDALWS